MILADTSVWIDHLRSDSPAFAALLNSEQVLVHPYVVGEIALGTLRQRDVVLQSLAGLPTCVVALHEEVVAFIERNALFGRGIGYVDAHLLASTALTPEARLLTRDKRLDACASTLGLAADSRATL